MARGTRWLNIGIIHLALLVAGGLVALLGVLDSFAPAVVTVTLLGVTLSGTGIGSQILLQTLVDDEVRGRVSSFWSMLAFGGTSLGSLLIGSSAHVFGLQPSVVVTGLLCIIVTLLTAFRRRAGRRRPSA
jgi:MFS family permease